MFRNILPKLKSSAGKAPRDMGLKLLVKETKSIMRKEKTWILMKRIGRRRMLIDRIWLLIQKRNRGG